MNTLEIVLEEAGFIKQNGYWQPRQPLKTELVAIG
jgi:hypothetical protein